MTKLYLEMQRWYPRETFTFHEYLANENFSTQIGNDNPFGCIPVDQTIEETINKGTQTQTPGGTKKFSTKKVPCQGIVIQPITEHLTLDNSDTWQIVTEIAFDIQILHHLGL